MHSRAACRILAPASNDDEEDDDDGVGVLRNFVLQRFVPNGELHMSPAIGALFVLLERGGASIGVVFVQKVEAREMWSHR